MAWDDDNFSGGGNGSSPTDIHAIKADLQRQLDHNAGFSKIRIEEKDGKNYLFGFELPKGSSATVQTLLGFLQTIGIGQAPKVYNIAKSIAGAVPKFGKSSKFQNVIAQATEYLYLAGIIGTEHIVEFVRLTREWSVARQQIKDDFSAAAKASGEKSGDIKMLQLAYKEADHQYWEGLGKLGIKSIKIVPQLFLAVMQTKAAKEQRKKDDADKAKAAAKKKADDDFKNLPLKEQLAELDRREAAGLIELLAREKQKREYVDRQVEHVNERMKDAGNKAVAALPANTALERQEEVRTQAEQLYYERFGEPRISQAESSYVHPLEKQTAEVDKLVTEQAAKDEAKRKEEEKNSERILQGLSIVAPGAADIASAYWGSGDENRRNRVHSWDMVKSLTRDMESQRRHESADDITVTGMVGEHRESISLKQALVDIFQQYERDKHPEKPFLEKRMGHHGEERVLINPLGEALVEQLTQKDGIIDLLANRIADRSVSPDILKIVMAKILRPEGIAGIEQVEKMVNDLIPVFRQREMQTLDKTLADFEKKAEAKKIIEENLANLKGVDRAVFAGLFSNDVLLEMKVRDKGITDLRKEAECCWNDFLISSAGHIAQLPEEQIKGLKLSKTHMNAIQEVAEAVERGDKKTLEVAANNGELIAAVRIAVLNEQINNGLGKDEGKAFLANRIKEIPATRKKIEDAAKRQGEEKADDPYEQKNDAAEQARSRLGGEDAAPVDDEKGGRTNRIKPAVQRQTNWRDSLSKANGEGASLMGDADQGHEEETDSPMRSQGGSSGRAAAFKKADSAGERVTARRAKDSPTEASL